MSKLDPKAVTDDLIIGAVFVQDSDPPVWLQVIALSDEGKVQVRCLDCRATGRQRRSRVIKGIAACPRCIYAAYNPEAELWPLGVDGRPIRPDDMSMKEAA